MNPHDPTIAQLKEIILRRLAELEKALPSATISQSNEPLVKVNDCLFQHE